MKFLLFLLLSLSIALTAIPNEFKFEIQEGKYTLSYGPDTQDLKKVWFRLQYPDSKGWLAIGTGELDKMANMDIWKFYYMDDKIHARDEYVIGAVAPKIDLENNLELFEPESSYDLESGKWDVIFSRRLNTKDEKDKKLYCGENSISFGHGRNHRNSRHFTRPIITTMFIDSSDFDCRHPDDMEETETYQEQSENNTQENSEEYNNMEQNSEEQNNSEQNSEEQSNNNNENQNSDMEDDSQQGSETEPRDETMEMNMSSEAENSEENQGNYEEVENNSMENVKDNKTKQEEKLTISSDKKSKSLGTIFYFDLKAFVILIIFLFCE